MAEKGLGMGLGALFGDEFLNEDSKDFEYLPISKIEPRAQQPRKAFDEQGLEELAESIKEHGVIQPLTVRELEGGYYQIIAGERRWRASRMAGLSEVPARIIEADDKKTMELALVENLQRENLNPAEEARGYQVLMNEYSMTQEEVAARVGKSRPAVANAVRLLALPDEIISLLEKGEIASGAARALLSLEDDGIKIKAAKKIAEEKLSVREAEKLVKTLSKKPGKKKNSRDSGNDIYYEDAQRQLSGALGRKVKISGSGSRGKIEIEYYDLEDFERLYEILSKLGG